MKIYLIISGIFILFGFTNVQAGTLQDDPIANDYRTQFLSASTPTSAHIMAAASAAHYNSRGYWTSCTKRSLHVSDFTLGYAKYSFREITPGIFQNYEGNREQYFYRNGELISIQQVPVTFGEDEKKRTVNLTHVKVIRVDNEGSLIIESSVLSLNDPDVAKDIKNYPFKSTTAQHANAHVLNYAICVVEKPQ